MSYFDMYKVGISGPSIKTKRREIEKFKESVWELGCYFARHQIILVMAPELALHHFAAIGAHQGARGIVFGYSCAKDMNEHRVRGYPFFPYVLYYTGLSRKKRNQLITNNSDAVIEIVPASMTDWAANDFVINNLIPKARVVKALGILPLSGKFNFPNGNYKAKVFIEERPDVLAQKVINCLKDMEHESKEL